jgi:hypothetical protein
MKLLGEVMPAQTAVSGIKRTLTISVTAELDKDVPIGRPARLYVDRSVKAQLAHTPIVVALFLDLDSEIDDIIRRIFLEAHVDLGQSGNM